MSATRLPAAAAPEPPLLPLVSRFLLSLTRHLLTESFFSILHVAIEHV